MVKGENTFGCLGSAVFTVKAKEYPTFTANDTTSCKGMPSTVKVKTGNAGEIVFAPEAIPVFIY
mgnify:FL=1